MYNGNQIDCESVRKGSRKQSPNIQEVVLVTSWHQYASMQELLLRWQHDQASNLFASSWCVHLIRGWYISQQQQARSLIPQPWHGRPMAPLQPEQACWLPHSMLLSGLLVCCSKLGAWFDRLCFLLGVVMHSVLPGHHHLCVYVCVRACVCVCVCVLGGIIRVHH